MEPLPTEPISSGEEVQETQGPASPSALSVRLWEYRGPQERLQDLPWQSDPVIAELVRGVAGEAHGVVSANQQDRLLIHFGNTLAAVAAAKALQVRLLAAQRTAPAAQVIAAAIVHDHAETASTNSELLLANILIETASAQILVTERVYEAAKDIPGFSFQSKPVHHAGERGLSEAIYELLWTDESTYSHVRKTGQAALQDVTGTGRYQLLSELGRGAMGVVYKAYDQVIGRTVALKTISIRQNFGDEGELVERLKQEAKAAGRLDHPNIITIFDVGQEKDFVYLSMQFIEGKTLGALLNGRELPPYSTLLSYANQICAAVGFAHRRGVIHRDLKPANFMLTGEGVVKVLDFGIAKFGDASVTQTGVVVGTPNYMAPEQVTGKKLDQRSDIFSLGIVFYELFTREKPFKGDIPAVLYKLIHDDPAPPSVINPALPMGIDAIIRKAMAKKPQDRYQNCEELSEALRAQAALLEDSRLVRTEIARPSDSTPITTSSRVPAKKKRGSGGFAWVMFVALSALGALGALGSWGYRAKNRTGSLPPSWQKVCSLARNVRAHTLRVGFANGTSVTSLPERTDSAVVSNGGASSNQETVKIPAEASNATSTAAAQITSTTNSAEASTPSAIAPPQSDGGQTIATSGPAQSSPQEATTPALPTSTDKTTTTATANSAQDDAQDKTVDTSETNNSDSTTSISPAGQRNRKQRLTGAGDSNARVEGFSVADIPDLLRKADAAAGSGDYALARYEYGIVLRLAPRNVAAHNGLVRVMAARQEQFQR